MSLRWLTCVFVLFSVACSTRTPADNKSASSSQALTTSVAGHTPGNFSVSPSGAATYSIPIPIAPGTAGVQPQLALSYNSQSGNGIAGVGWNLTGLSVITRCPATHAVDGVRSGVNLDANDKLCLDGQRLILQSGDYGQAGAVYYTEAFNGSKITQASENLGRATIQPINDRKKALGYTGNGESPQAVTPSSSPIAFRVQTKAGETMEYIASDIATSSSQFRPRLWLLVKVKDVKGNYFTVSYDHDDVAGEYRPIRIDYTGNNDITPPLTPYNKVEFGYEARIDVSLAYLGEAKISNTRRLKSIRTYADATLVKEYRLDYGSGYSAATGRSLLQSITECEGSGNCLLPTTLAWTGGQRIAPGTPSVYYLAAGGSPSDRWFTMADVNGDGRTDTVRYEPSSGFLYVSLANTNGSFASPVSTSFGAGGSPSERWFTMADVNADGRADAVRYEPGNGFLYVALANANGGFASPVSTSFGAGGSPNDRWFTMADVDGDGRADAVRYEPGNGFLYVALANANGGFASLASTSFGAGGSPGDRWFTMADVNADGRADAVRYEPGNGFLYVALSNASRGFAPAVSTYFGGGGSPSDRWFTLADVNGDSRPDAVRYEPTTGVIAVAYGLGTGTFGPPVGASGHGAGGSPGDRWFMLADVNGDGLADAVRYEPGNGNIVLSKASGGSGFPDLVNNVHNGLTGIAVTAWPLTNSQGQVYTKDSGALAASNPTADLQPPLYAVASVAVANGIGGTLTTHYRYGGLKLELNGRGLLGFRWMQTTQAESGLVNYTEFRQNWPYIGQPAVTQTRTGAGALLNQTVPTPACKRLDGSACVAGASAIAYVSDAVERAWDLNGAALPQTRTHTDVDNFGNATSIVVDTLDAAGNVTGYRKTTTNVYDNLTDAGRWSLARLRRSTVRHDAPSATNATRTSSFDYDGQGLQTRATVEPDQPCLRLVTDTAYDPWGNKRQITVSGGATTGTCNTAIDPRTTITGYDARGQFQVSVTNALGQTETHEFDARFGGMTKLTGPNGLATRWTYDSFGRKSAETRADGTSTTWSYQLYLEANLAYYIYSQATGGPGTRAYFDRLDRPVRSYTEHFHAGAWVGTGRDYDARGRVVREYRPFFDADSARPATTFEYDLLDRVTKSTAPSGSTATVYDGLTTRVTDPLGRVTVSTRNLAGQAAQVLDAAGKTITYAYDALGNANQTNAGGVVSTATYDLRGFKTSMTDPDMGTWTYRYNALGELSSQQDAKGQVTTIVYDKLGRMTQRTEPGLVSTWQYDVNRPECGTTVDRSRGKLARAITSTGYSRIYCYDSLGRAAKEITAIGAESFTTQTTFDVSGHVNTQSYPTGFALQYSYTPTGALAAVRNAATGGLFWQANSVDAAGHITRDTLGNSLLTDRLYDAKGRLTSIGVGTGGGYTVQNQIFGYDAVDNLTRRTWTENGTAYSESFTYDNLNRIMEVTGPAAKSYRYDALGSITSKTGVGSYNYPAATAPGPHRPTSITGTVGGVVNPSFTYDANGNMTAGAGTSIAWSSFNMPTTITKGGITDSFSYGPEHQRTKQIAGPVTTYYGSQYEKEINANTGVTEHKHYVHAAGMLIAQVTTRSSGANDTRYFHTDHLGSVSVVTNETGGVVQRLSYDAFGRRRNSNGTDGAITTAFDRGYTGHEMLDNVGLVHMNGRVYNPITGQFVSADPIIQAPGNLQSYNRYAYVINNPLSLTDPSGYSWLSDRWHDIWNSTVGRIAISVAVGWFTGGLVSSWITNSMWASAGACTTAGITVGNVVGGAAGGFAGSMVASNGDINAGLRGAVTGGVFGFAGSIGDAGSLERYAAHAGAGCISGELNGGGCGRGAASGVLGKLATNYTKGNFIATIVAGGTVSAITGGKFENGATTATFGYLFNQMSCRTAPFCRPSLYDKNGTAKHANGDFNGKAGLPPDMSAEEIKQGEALRVAAADFLDKTSKVFMFGSAIVATFIPPFDVPAPILFTIGVAANIGSDLLRPEPAKIMTDRAIDQIMQRLFPLTGAAMVYTRMGSETIKELKNMAIGFQ
jgi:RHS repeat-associated protein